jgi:peptidyl-prolyl cis-trans isomerase SurA
LQVESFFPARCRFAALFLISGAALVSVAGCHRTPAPDVMATVNGKELLRSELDQKFLVYKLSLGDSPQQPSTEQANIMRLALLRSMIDDEIMQQRAAKFNLAASDEDVNAKLVEMKAAFTPEDFDKQLKQRNQTLDDLKRDIRHNLTQNKLLNKEIESKINITEAEISAYFAAHKSEFNVIEPQYRLAQIGVTSAPAQQTGNLQNNKASGDADAKRKIQALHNRLDSGEEFGNVAMQFSETNTASNGGDMGFVAESALRNDPEVYNALSKLKPGQYTDILPIVDGPSRRVVGYAIYKLISREPAGQRELNDPRVQQSIHQLLHEGHAQLLKNAYFEKIHDEARVHNYLADEILAEGAR